MYSKARARKTGAERIPWAFLANSVRSSARSVEMVGVASKLSWRRRPTRSEIIASPPEPHPSLPASSRRPHPALPQPGERADGSAERIPGGKPARPSSLRPECRDISELFRGTPNPASSRDHTPAESSAPVHLSQSLASRRLSTTRGLDRSHRPAGNSLRGLQGFAASVTEHASWWAERSLRI